MISPCQTLVVFVIFINIILFLFHNTSIDNIENNSRQLFSITLKHVFILNYEKNQPGYFLKEVFKIFYLLGYLLILN